MNNGSKIFADAVEQIPHDIKKRVDWSMEVSDRLAAILAERGMTQRQFARMLGRSEAEVSRWLGGTHNFTFSTLAKISAAIGTDLISIPKP